MSYLRLTKIDALHLASFAYLRPDDDCYYLGEYTAREGYGFSRTNQLIYNLKKSPSERGRPSWSYKLDAIRACAHALVRSLPSSWLDRVTMVPVPPSKPVDDALYDDRIFQLLVEMARRAVVECDVRELILQEGGYEAAHLAARRPRPEELLDRYRLNQGAVHPKPRSIAVVDDVISSGAHFRAAKDRLQEQWPDVPVVGLFVARAVRLPSSTDGPRTEIG